MNVTLKLNARLQPRHRFDLEDAIDEIMQAIDLGEVTGGGTGTKPSGEIAFCCIDIELKKDDDESIRMLTKIVNEIEVPKGSFIETQDDDIGVGTQEGLAIYLNGTDLPEDVYKSCDINHAIDILSQAVEGIGSLYSFWEGNEATALYYYGSSFEEMEKLIKEAAKTYPLCDECRIERIA